MSDGGGFIVTVHIIIVDGQEVYNGEDWGKAQQLFINHVHELATREIYHRVTKRVVPYGDPLSATDWGDRRRKS
jgi:hypothetical protein